MPDSELFIIPSEGGEARRLRANTPRMNSWHSFSSNGRWLVFSSKANTPYTQLFLTHIDAEGRSTPPVVLERFTGSDRAANIPEFVPIASDAIAKIEEQFLDAYSFLRAGMANERTGNYPGAVRAYQRGLDVDPDNVELLNALGFSLFQQGKSQDAVAALEKALAVDPKHAKAHNNLARASIDIGELEVAEAHYRESLAIEVQPAVVNDLGFVLERQGLPDEAVELYREALALDPELVSARFNLAASLTRRGEFAAAEREFRAALAQDPDSRTHAGLGVVLWKQGRVDDALASLDAAIAADAKNLAAYDQLGALLSEEGRLEQAVAAYRAAVTAAPTPANHRKLAQVLARLGRAAEARQQMERANALEGDAR